MLEFDINHSQISYSLKTHEQYSVAAGGENYGLGNFLVDYLTTWIRASAAKVCCSFWTLWRNTLFMINRTVSMCSDMTRISTWIADWKT